MKNTLKTAMIAATMLASSASFAMTIAEQVKAAAVIQEAKQIEIYKNYVPNPEDGEFASLGNRVYLKMTAPHYFKKGDSLEWKDESASYWK